MQGRLIRRKTKTISLVFDPVTKSHRMCLNVTRRRRRFGRFMAANIESVVILRRSNNDDIMQPLHHSTDFDQSIWVFHNAERRWKRAAAAEGSGREEYYSARSNLPPDRRRPRASYQSLRSPIRGQSPSGSTYDDEDPCLGIGFLFEEKIPNFCLGNEARSDLGPLAKLWLLRSPKFFFL